jgi:endonuclease/exonuclease/phosphatase family metal-dependent hydrolase
MLVKLILVALLLTMIVCAVHFAPGQGRALLGTRAQGGTTLRVLTWNVGYAELEDDTRAHDADLPAVAEVILSTEPDACALQELTGEAQLRALLKRLGGRYRGALAQQGRSDRFEAVLVKDANARFTPFPAGDRYALGATFRPRADAHEVLLISVHADAFSAERRRTYTESVVDWARAHAQTAPGLIAGDFNFELRAREETNLYTDNLKHDSESYSYLLRYFRDLGREAGDTAINDRRIDYIFGAGETLALRRAEVLRAAAVGRMDHWPLVVEITY